MKVIKFDQDLLENKSAQENDTSLYGFPIQSCHILSYACSYGTSIEKIDLIKNCTGGFFFNQRDHLGRTTLQSLVLNRNISLKERLDYI
jgi:hypothetical protein